MNLFRSYKFFRLALLLSLFLLGSLFSNAQYFENVYGDDSTTKGVFFTVTKDHQVIIIGDAVDSITLRTGYFILKLDAGGKVLWEKRIVDRNDAYSYSITTLSDGRIVLLGSHISDSYPVVAEILVLDSTGEVINSAIYPPFNGWGTAGVALTNSSDTSVTLTLYNDGFISNNFYSVFSLN